MLQENQVDYLVAAGGGGDHLVMEVVVAGTRFSAGNSIICATPGDGYPSSVAAITVTAQGYPITVGGGGHLQDQVLI